MEKTDPKEQFERKETVLVRSPFLRYNKLKVQYFITGVLR